MSVVPMFAGLLVAISFVHTTGAAENPPSYISYREIPFNLTKQNIVSIDPGKDISREEFYDGMGISGQFEVLIPKKLFPIPAPNCRKNVILRVGSVNQAKLYSNEKLEARWQLFQSLHAVLEGKMAGVEIKIPIGPDQYMKLDKQGNPVLEWCNAGIELESASERAAASAAHKAGSSKEMLFNLTQQNIVSIKPEKNVNREMFDYGQKITEIRIPKALFPISAPNCQEENVVLRIPIASENRSARQDRWRLFQSLHAVAAGKMSNVEVSLRLGDEMGFDRQDGHPVLESCNVYLHPKPVSHKPFTAVH